MYLVFNPINEDMNISRKKEIYRLINKAMLEYEQNNTTAIDLAEGCYFRGDDEDLSKLQSRNVMTNTVDEAVELEDIVLIAEEGLNNKEIIKYLTEWFSKNTDVELIGSQIDSSQMKDIKNKSYYDIALINLEASFAPKEDFLAELSFYIPDELLSRINSLNDEEQKRAAFLEIEDALFDSYRVLPLLFYNENIAINDGIKNVILDGNGNLSFDSMKK
jgi:peptide/nickel transport system substrate-binding protein